MNDFAYHFRNALKHTIDKTMEDFIINVYGLEALERYRKIMNDAPDNIASNESEIDDTH